MSVDNRTAANLTAVLVDYGPDGCSARMVTRGWLDPQVVSTDHDYSIVPTPGPS